MIILFLKRVNIHYGGGITMKSKYLKILSLVLVLIFLLSACGTEKPAAETPEERVNLEEQIKEKDTKIGELEIKIKEQEDKIAELESTPNQTPTLSSNNLITVAMDVLDSIKNKDMNTLATFVHQTNGLRFTPYEYVDGQNDQVFNPSQVAALANDSQVYTWGSYDGSGDPIDLDFSDYYDQFIYDEDFINPHIIGNNVAIGSGNIINNITTEYPNAQFVEFHFTGFDPQYEGIDWRSLTLVFEDVGGLWYLVGIVHGQWTI